MEIVALIIMVVGFFLGAFGLIGILSPAVSEKEYSAKEQLADLFTGIIFLAIGVVMLSGGYSIRHQHKEETEIKSVSKVYEWNFDESDCLIRQDWKEIKK